MTDRLDDRIHALMERVVDEAPLPPMLPDEPATTGRVSAPGWVIGLAVAAVVLVVVGGASVLLGGRLDSDPLPPTESPTPTTVAGLEVLPDIPVYEFGSYELTDWLTVTDVADALGLLASDVPGPLDVVGWSNHRADGGEPTHESWEFTTGSLDASGEVPQPGGGWYLVISEYPISDWDDEPEWNEAVITSLPDVRISGPHVDADGRGPWFHFSAPRTEQIVSVFLQPPDTLAEAIAMRDSASVAEARRKYWTFDIAEVLLSEMRWILPDGPRITVTLDEVRGLVGATLEVRLERPGAGWGGAIDGGARFSDIETDPFTGTAEILPIDWPVARGPFTGVPEGEDGHVALDHPGLGPVSDDHRLVLIAHESIGSSRIVRVACQVPLWDARSGDRIDLRISSIPRVDPPVGDVWPDQQTYPICVLRNPSS